MAENLASVATGAHRTLQVVDRIGRGAMGVVYSAHDELMGRDVAVKVMMTDLEDEPDIRARFMREAQVSAKLAHRNIVTIFDIGEDNGRLFIVMELLRGETLDRCAEAARASRSRRRSISMLEVCEGLAVASAAGVCHRDVKPGNLFVQADGRSEDPRLRHRPPGELEHDGQRLHRRHARLHVARAGARQRRSTSAPTSSRSARCCI